MTPRTPSPPAGGPTTEPGSVGSASVPRRRDAQATRQMLIVAARRRFAADGYSATTVRDIADDAGVNVALISRYFSSKAGLFEACLHGSAEELGRSVVAGSTLEQMPELLARQLAGADADSRPNQMLLLLLRSSGDEQVDQIRHAVLHSFGERLAETAGWQRDAPDGEQLLLRAQITLAAAFGIVLLRSVVVLQPLASADEDDLRAPMRDLVEGLLHKKP